MIAGEKHLAVDADTDWYVHLLCADDDGNTINFTGYTAIVAHIAQARESATPISIGAEFVLLDETTSATQGDGAGIIKLSMTQAQFDNIDWTNGYWDAHAVEPAGTRVCLLRGQFIIRPAVAA